MGRYYHWRPVLVGPENNCMHCRNCAVTRRNFVLVRKDNAIKKQPVWKKYLTFLSRLFFDLVWLKCNRF